MNNDNENIINNIRNNIDYDRVVVFPEKDTKGLINWNHNYRLKDWIPCHE